MTYRKRLEVPGQPVVVVVGLDTADHRHGPLVALEVEQGRVVLHTAARTEELAGALAAALGRTAAALGWDGTGRRRLRRKLDTGSGPLDVVGRVRAGRAEVAVEVGAPAGVLVLRSAEQVHEVGRALRAALLAAAGEVDWTPPADAADGLPARHEAAAAVRRAGLARLARADPAGGDWFLLDAGVGEGDVAGLLAELAVDGLGAGEYASRREDLLLPARRRPRRFRVVRLDRRPVAVGGDGLEVCPTCRDDGGPGCATCGGGCWLCDPGDGTGDGTVECPDCDGGGSATALVPHRRCDGAGCAGCDHDGTVWQERRCAGCAGTGRLPCPRGPH